MSIKMTTFILITILFVTIFIAILTFIKSSNWVDTKGIVEEIELIEKYNRPDLAMSENRKSFDYIINLKYIYTVNNRKYTGTKIYPGLPNIFDNKNDAENILKKFSKNTKATVFYEPSNPNSASLITSKSMPIKGIVTLVVLVLFISIFVIGGILIFPKL